MSTMKGGVTLTQEAKNIIKEMREQGAAFPTIAARLGMKRDTVKIYCYRHGIQPPSADTTPADSSPENRCVCCGGKLPPHIKGKQRRFCSDACRHRWWSQNRSEHPTKSTYLVTCSHCGKVFSSYDPDRKYCCHPCYINDRFGEWNDDKETVRA